mmetsp:Transcript_19182/g.40377  ORF Transcript_19182/g.40377 Transcript_19182/m.40377 type:complete len:466 (+) Transcript_19182:389-1786(+)|eukprot:CAMPEP_0168178168 /NCGR_PEP_ID=MMETSP0139_2-20121125/8939_1 /TAXON_ID=44445 /ORGANISM="Pseudo-nitzschia australis, Strain 10249 10 AB" /LENGTH=465 /DNA_ID=CAMNT_0008097459 /DNA_START=233 /DNA_END=1633 /DNA_ORIENTATION=-
MVQGVVIDSDNCLVNTNPATGEIISRVKCTTPGELEGLIDTAKVSQREWRTTSVEDRVNLLKTCMDELAAISDPMIELIVKEMGKPIGEAKEEVDYAVVVQEEYFDILLESLTPKTYGKSTVVRHPYGVVAIMSPWNFPLGEIMLLALPSLASGNTVIVKPSEVVPETGALMVRTLQKVLPPGVIQLAQGSGSVGAALVAHPGIDLVAMTGSSATGKKILESAAPLLKRVILEMGGKDPMIVCADADLEKAAKDAVFYSLSNTGQVCCSIERIYVADSVYDEFQELSKAAAKTYKVGNGMDADNQVGPMVSMIQKDHVHDQVEDALAKGAKLLHQSEIPGSENSGGQFYPVTVLADVNENMKLFTKETFGPVVAIAKFDGTEKEAVRLANDTEYGLGSSVYTEDTEKANRIAALIDAGQVGINCYPLEFMGIQCPWVGHKQSGFGFHSGVDGCLQFSIPKTIVSR